MFLPKIPGIIPEHLVRTKPWAMQGVAPKHNTTEQNTKQKKKIEGKNNEVVIGCFFKGDIKFYRA